MVDRCAVRSMRSEDLLTVLGWRNHPDVRRYMITQHEISPREHEDWFMAASQDSARRLLIVEEAGDPLGYVQFENVAVGAAANWGFYCYPNAPKGTGKKLGAAALNYGFSELQLHKICGQALAFNISSIRFHRRLGFVQEGVLRDQHLINGVYHDLVCFGLLRREWTPADVMGR